MSTPEDLNARLAAAEAAHAEAAQRRAEARSRSEMAARVEAAERAAADENALAEAESQHGAERIGIVETDLGRIILKRPHPAKFKQFQDSDRVTVDAVDEYVRSCLVYPEPARYDAICRELPATITRCGRVCNRLAGERAQAVEGKA